MSKNDYTGGVHFRHYGACIVNGDEVEVAEVDFCSLAKAIGEMDDDFVEEFCKSVRKYQKALNEQGK